MKKRRKTIYWVNSNKIMACEAEYWNDNTTSGWFKDTRTQEVLKEFNSPAKAQKAFLKMMEALGEKSKFKRKS